MRFEYKYIVHNKYLTPLREVVIPFLEMDKFAEAGSRNQYTVRSIYFDTPSYDFYYEKVDGIKNRKKVRLRGYDENRGEEKVFLEIKRKYDIPIVKYRAELLYENALNIFKEHNLNGYAVDKLTNISGYQNSKRFFYQVFSKNLRPVVLIVYEREAFFSKLDNTVRITFDKNLRGMAYPRLEDLFNNYGLSAALNNYFILEVKFNNYFPAWLNPVISKFGLLKQSASKYVITMDSSKVIRHLTKSSIYTHSKWYN
ncbi:MAG: polyphosphate polymerase domain-containing protein [Bacteroidales bacterium]|nr:polyphosphate polymerase domain-containing protein [Bacteroidales bacterium]MCF8405029.1 polyphosphate polymerase domain-containing protein [Bacteroidales bacterium]